MASEIKVTPQNEEMSEKEGPESPPLDLSDAAVLGLLHSAKKRGYVTNDQINALLSLEEVKSEQIEDILAKLSEMGVHVVETDPELEVEVAAHEEPEEEAEGELVEVQQRPVSVKSEAKDPAERTDDPVRMYLRDMGSVALLSRAGEVAIAKRIEAGREIYSRGSARAHSLSRLSPSGGTSSRRAKSTFATSSTSTRPMRAPTPRPCRRR